MGRKKSKVKGSKDINEYINIIRSKCYAIYNEMVSLKSHIYYRQLIPTYKKIL